MAATIYAVRNDRLGGRLGAMLNAARIAADYGAKIRFLWPDHAEVSAELRCPQALFTADFLQECRETDCGYGTLLTGVQPLESLAPHLSRAEFVERLAAGENMRCSEALRPVILPWEEAAEVAARMGEILAGFGLTPPVRAAMAAIDQSLSGAVPVAYHLRRGDIINPALRPSNVLWPQKYVPRVFYEEHIARALGSESSGRIVIFSDAPHEISAFCALSERVIPAEKLIDASDLPQIARDFLEIHAMSRCARIIGPGASAFSSVAALLGQSQIVEIAADLTPEEETRAMKRLSHRLEREPDLFAGDADLGQNFPALIRHHRAEASPAVACRILRQHRDRGFAQSYIHDLLAEEEFRRGAYANVLALAEDMGERPIRTDFANAPVYVWAGFAALALGDTGRAARFAHIANWLQPLWPLTRLLMSTIELFGLFETDARYPIAAGLTLLRRARSADELALADQINAGLLGRGRLPPVPGHLALLPSEIEIRDWARLQGGRLPPSFSNLAGARRMIGFFRSTYRRALSKPAVSSLLGQMEYRSGDAALGADLIRRAAEDAPEDALIAIRSARLLAQSNRSAGLEAYERAAALSGDQICFQAEFGLRLMEFGEKKRALAIFREIAARNHPLIEIDLLAADALRRHQGSRELALSLAERALAKVPGGLRSAQLCRKILEQLGREEEAEALRQRYLDWGRNPGKFSSRIIRE